MSRTGPIKTITISHEGYAWTVELWERKTIVEATHPSIKGSAFGHTFNHNGWQDAMSEREYVVSVLNGCIKAMKEHRR